MSVRQTTNIKSQVMSMQDPNALNEETNSNLENTPNDFDPGTDMDQQESTTIPPEKVLSEIDPTKKDLLHDTIVTETPSSSKTEIMTQPEPNAQEVETQESVKIPQQDLSSQTKADSEAKAPVESGAPVQESAIEDEKKAFVDPRSSEQLVSELEKLVNLPNAGELVRQFNQLKDWSAKKITFEVKQKLQEFIQDGSLITDFEYEHPQQSKFIALCAIFREKNSIYSREQEELFKDNLEARQAIIERLKNIYTSNEPGLNLFHEIRAIKKDWTEAGQVAKSQFKLLNNNYYHHLNQFYEMLDLNKEYLQQEYLHNLEKRQHIIERAKDLLKEPVQKALNELQYLHKLWKEEGEPVAEEFRESTWNEFKALSNQIHDRRAELHSQLDAKHTANYQQKQDIITQINHLSAKEKPASHSDFQKTIQLVENLRTEFLKIGSVPKEHVGETWDEFKQALRLFNATKNKFYKSLKSAQQENLVKKQALIEKAKEHMNSEDWEAMVPLYKSLQNDWKAAGQVPRHLANKIWDEFREACNTFFENYRTKSPAAGDNWTHNYKEKKELLTALEAVTDKEGSVEEIESIKARWNSIGKVPKDKLSIHAQFNKLLREKLKLNNASEYDLKDENLSESQLTDKARKIKNQIADLEAQISTLETNLSFFKSPARDNPLLKDTFDKLDDKKEQLERLKSSLHHIIVGD